MTGQHYGVTPTGFAKKGFDAILTDFVKISANRIVATPTGLRYRTDGPITLLANTTSVSVPITAEEMGSNGNVPENSITVIPTPIMNIDSVTNPSPTTTGSDRETDAALRLRILNYAPGARGTLSGLKAALMAVPGVTACTMTEDTALHTVTATVLGGDTATVQQKIHEMRPAGIPCILVRPTARPISVTATVTTCFHDGAEERVNRAVLAALDAFFTTSTLGAGIPYSRVAAVISDVDMVTSLTSLSLQCGETTITQLGQTLPITKTELAVGGTHAITVVKVEMSE